MASEQGKNRKEGRDGKGRFLPGVSGNPGGRRKKPITEWLEKILDEKLPDGMTRAEYVARKLMTKAAQDGDLAAIKEVTDRVEGKARETVDLNIEDDFPQEEIDKIDAFANGEEETK